MSDWMNRATPVISAENDPISGSDWMSRAIPAEQSNEDILNQYNDLQAKHGGALEQAKAGVEGLERGITLGLSDLFHTKVLGDTPTEDLSGRMRANPVTSSIGQIAGGGALIGATGGVGGLLPETAGSAARIGAMALEGGVFGAGNALTDYALGDPELNAQKVMAHIGMGAALGGGLGALGESVRALSPKAMELANALKGRLLTKEGSSAAESIPIMDAPIEPKSGIQPTTIKDISDRVRQAQYKGYSIELPQKAALEDAASRIELDAAIHPLQSESLGSQQARDAYKTILEMPGKEGDVLRGYEAVQKRELNDKIDSTIKSIAPKERTVEADAQKNGEIAANIFKKQYRDEQRAAGDLVKQAKSYSGEGFNHLEGVINAMSEKVPSIGKMIDVSGDEISIAPYKTSMGISKQTYNAVKDAVESLRENPQDFSDLFAIRKGLDNGVNPLTSDASTVAEVRALKSSMMDYMQRMVDDSMPELRDGFRRYAINEEKRAVIQRNFGIDINDVKPYEVGKPQENITNKIFSNSETVDAARAILPKEDFRHILSNYLAQAKEDATSTEGVFSSKKFDNFLNKKQHVLNEALADSPQEIQRLKDLALISRILPDSSSINPSGTAKTLINHLESIDSLTGYGLKAAKLLKEKTFGKIEHQMQLNALNEQLQGRAAQASILGEIEKVVKKTNEQVSNAAKRVFTYGGTIGTVHQDSPKHYDKHAKKVAELSDNPTKMFDHLNSVTQDMYSASPNVTQSLNGSMSTAVNFLNSKLPRPNHQMLFSPDWEPTNIQKEIFNNYFRIVNDPISILDDVRSGYLSNESMEAMHVVYPSLLQDLQMKVMENLNEKKVKNLNYSSKISISKFLGHPLDQSLLPQSIASNQAAFMASSGQAAQAQVRASTSSAKQIDLADRSRTQTEKDDEE